MTRMVKDKHLFLKSSTTEMGVITKNTKDEKVLRAVTGHVMCLFDLYIRQMDLENDCDYYQYMQVVTPIAADIPNAVFLLEQINITPVIW